MLDLRLLYEIPVIEYLIMVSVFYGVFRIVKYLIVRR